MASFSRKSAPKVRNGKTQRKNRTALTPYYSQTCQLYPAIDRQRPGPGYRHLITQKQLHQFIELLPDWEELSRGLDAVILAPGEENLLGWYRPRRVAVCAWEKNFKKEWHVDFIREHAAILERLGVEPEPIYDSAFAEQFDRPDPCYELCKFTETSTRRTTPINTRHKSGTITSRSSVGDFPGGKQGAKHFSRLGVGVPMLLKPPRSARSRWRF